MTNEELDKLEAVIKQAEHRIKWKDAHEDFVFMELFNAARAHLATAQRATIDAPRTLQALDGISHALDCYANGGTFPKGDCHETQPLLKELRDAITSQRAMAGDKGYLVAWMDEEIKAAEELLRITKDTYPENYEHPYWGRLVVLKQIRAALNSQSVPVEVLHQSPKLAAGNYDYQCGYLDCLDDVKVLAEPYVKGGGVDNT